MHISGIDHAIVAVDDLDAGEAAMRALGFRLSPRGVHSDHMGTHNATIMFAGGTYFELLAARVEREHNGRLRRSVADGINLFGLAMKTNDAEALNAELGALAEGEVNAFSRPVDTPGGPAEAAFRTTTMRADATPGVYAFACQHLTPELVWTDALVDQPNGVRALAAVVGVADDLGAVREAWSRFAEPSGEDDAVTFDFANAALRFLRPERFAAEFGTTPASPGATPHLAALVLAGDLAKARGAITAPTVERAGGLMVAPEHAAGVTMHFVNEPGS